MARTSRSILLLALLPCIALAVGAALTWPLVAKWHGDLEIYARYADKLFQGQIPYRDFLPEYPPLALVAFALPRLLVGGAALSNDQFRTLFLLENLLFVWIIAAATLSIALVTRYPLRRATLALTLFVLILSPFLGWRFDLFPAMLTALGLLALVRGQAGFGGGWLGLGVAAKLYPLVLGPIAALDNAVARTWRSLIGLVFGAVLAVAVTVLPFLLLEPAGLLHFLSYHEERGIQIESLAGGIVCLARIFGLTDVDRVFNYGAWHLVSPWATVLLPWLTPLLVILYAVIYVIAWRSRRQIGQTATHGIATLREQRAVWLVLACCVALLVFMTTNKVFSPQYLAWLLPFAALLTPRQIGLFALICGLTVIIFPFGYDALVAFVPWAVVILNLRNLALALLLGGVLRRLARGWLQNESITYAAP